MSNVTFKRDGLTYDGLPPSGARMAEPWTEIDYVVCSIADHFARAQRGDTAFNVSTALASLQTQMSSGRHPRISGAQRDALRSAVISARQQVISLFSQPAECAHAGKCLDAVIGLLWMWSESDTRRAARHDHVRPDCQAYARWLRNACHNLCLVEEIQTRARDRREDTVREILESAIA